MLNRLKTETQFALQLSARLIAEPRYMFTFFGLFFVIVLLLQWLFQIEHLWQILGSDALNVIEKIDTLVDGFTAVFRQITDLTPISFILIAFLQGLSLVILIAARQARNKKTRKHAKSLGLGLIGSGCVACGGSVLSPLLSLVATELSVTVAQAIGDVVLVIAVVYSYWTWIQIAKQSGLRV